MTALAEKQAIRELKYRYGRATDEARIEDFLDLFTEDAAFDVGVYGSGQGRADLRGLIEWIADQDVEGRAHNMLNPLITVDGDTATGEWYYTVVYERTDGSAEFGQGYYEDEYRRVDGEWKISAMTAKRVVTREI